MSSAPDTFSRPTGHAPHGLKVFARGIIGSALLFGVIEYVTRLNIVPVQYLPHASTIAARIPMLLISGDFQAELGATILAWAAALIVAITISVPLGVVLGSSDWAFKFTAPVVNLMRPIPSVCLLPLTLVVLGSGFSMKLVLVAYATVWPILFNTIYGIHNVDPLTVQTARCFGLRPMAIIRRVSLPSAAPFIFTGVRISASIGLVVLVSAELLADAQRGIGSFIINESSGGTHMDIVFAAAAIAGLLGLAINLSLVAVDRWAFAWRYAKA
jgi:NitT/TauT family transport system permease protein